MVDICLSINKEEILKRGGSGLLNYYKGSLIKALRMIYGIDNSHEENFETEEKREWGHWNNLDNQKTFLLDLASKFGIVSTDKHIDWTQLTTNQVILNGGKGLLRHYNGSLKKALIALFPREEKNPTLDTNNLLGRVKKEPKYWKNPTNQRKFLEHVSQELGFKDFNEENWYSVKTKDILQLGGKGLLNRYDGSLIKALQHVYPEKEWHVWKFHQVPKNFWEVDTNVFGYLQWLSKSLGISHLDDWYSVSYEQIIELHGSSLFKTNKKQSDEAENMIVTSTLFGLLSKFYPYHPWDRKKFRIRSNGRWGKTQQLLLSMLQRVLSNNKLTTISELGEIKVNYKHPELMFTRKSSTSLNEDDSQTNSPQRMELDIYIPSLTLAFEYQGRLICQRVTNQIFIFRRTSLPLSLLVWSI